MKASLKLEYSLRVLSQLARKNKGGAVTRVEELAKLDWPPGVRWAFSGEVENQEESFGGMGKILLIAAFGIFGYNIIYFHTSIYLINIKRLSN